MHFKDFLRSEGLEKSGWELEISNQNLDPQQLQPGKLVNLALHLISPLDEGKKEIDTVIRQLIWVKIEKPFEGGFLGIIKSEPEHETVTIKGEKFQIGASIFFEKKNVLIVRKGK